MRTAKADKIKLAINSLLKKTSPVIREVASVVGLMVSSFPAVRYAPLFYRSLENDKTEALKANGWNLDDHMCISEQAIRHLNWWLNNVSSNPCQIFTPLSTVTLECDSSLEGWGRLSQSLFS